MASQHKSRYSQAQQRREIHQKATQHTFDDFLTPDQLKTMDNLNDEERIHAQQESLCRAWLAWAQGKASTSETADQIPMLCLNGNSMD
jgi:uncharacterized protein YbaP (TraB family)